MTLVLAYLPNSYYPYAHANKSSYFGFHTIEVTDFLEKGG